MNAPKAAMPRTQASERTITPDGQSARTVLAHMTTPDNQLELTPTAAFVRDVALLVSAQSAHDTGRVTLIVGRYVDWAQNSRGLPLSERLLFDPQVIDLYIRDAIEDKRLAKGSVATYRSVLRTTCEIVLPKDELNSVAGISQREQLTPYTPAQVELFQPWMLGQRTELLGRKAIALTCLGLGAGLRAGEILSLRREDVDIADGVVLSVSRGPRTRRVPMLTRWEPAFRSLIDPLDNSDYVFGAPHRRINPNSIGEFVQSANGRLRPNTFRMRSTWIVGRLASGIALSTLLNAAGLERLEKLAEYLPFLPEPEASEFGRLRDEVTL